MSSQKGQRSSEAVAQARTHGLWPAAQQPYGYGQGYIYLYSVHVVFGGNAIDVMLDA